MWDSWTNGEPHYGGLVDLEHENSWQPNAAGYYLTALDDYKDAAARLFPALPRRALDEGAPSPVDALALGHLLEHHPHREVTVLEVGAPVGLSAYFFASHPKVSRVVSVGPNREVSAELLAGSPDARSGALPHEPSTGVGTLDVARATLAEFGEERKKIELVEGEVGGALAGTGGAPANSPRKTDVPAVDPQEGTSLVAYMGGVYGREEARVTLEAIFDRNPQARFVLVNGCRYARGPFVQAGVVDFMEQAPVEYRFRLVGDLGPGLARSSVGILHPEPEADLIGRILSELSETFSRRLDPLRLLEREEDLIAVIGRLNQELNGVRKSENQLEARISRVEERESKRKEQVSRLEERNAQLTAHYQSRRYKLADVAADSALRIPGLRRVLR
jgi:hypothetical protein